MIDANGDESICLDELVDLIIMIMELLRKKREIKNNKKKEIIRKGFSVTTDSTVERMKEI